MSATLVQSNVTGEGTEVAERREPERWTDPRIILAVMQLLVALAGLAVVVFGGLIGIYVIMQTRDTASEVNGQALFSEVQKMSVTLSGVAEDVKDISNTNTAQTAKLEAHDKALSQNETNIAIVASKVGVVENKVATLQAQVGK